MKFNLRQDWVDYSTRHINPAHDFIQNKIKKDIQEWFKEYDLTLTIKYEKITTYEYIFDTKHIVRSTYIPHEDTKEQSTRICYRYYFEINDTALATLFKLTFA